MVHVSNIQQGRVNSAADLLARGQPVKVKVISLAGTRIGLSMKDVEQSTGRDLTPHLRIKSEAEMEEERNQQAARASSGANAIPVGKTFDDAPVRSAKRLSSPERWEIKQNGSVFAYDDDGDLYAEGEWQLEGTIFTMHYQSVAYNDYSFAGEYNESSLELTGTWGGTPNTTDGGTFEMAK